MSIDALLAGPLRVVNVGLESFARDLAAHGAPVVQVNWSPPRFPFDEAVEQANAEALRRVLAAAPALVDVRRAGELVPELDRRRLLLHAGPPLGWERMCGPLRGAICGAIVFEGWAADLAAAEELAASGAVVDRAQPPFRRGRPDDRDHHAQHAAPRGREPSLRQPRVLHHQRRPGQGHALRRQRRRGAGAACVVAR
jgi:hypothetical protein